VPKPCRRWHDDPPRPDSCHHCRLEATRPDYALLFGGGKAADAPRRAAPPACLHLREPTAETASCGNGRCRAKVFRCALHGKCTMQESSLGRCCAACLDWKGRDETTADVVAAPALSFPTRDLLYHVHPLPGPAWRENLDRLLAHWPLFTGRKLVAVTTGPGLDPPADVERHLGGAPGIELLAFPNDPKLREMVSLPSLLAMLAVPEPGRAVFWGHAKGVTRPGHPTAGLWSEVLHESLLGAWDAVEKVLQTHLVAGSFKKAGQGFTGSRSRWHYSGGFFVARSADLFSRNWRALEYVQYGAEIAPSLWFSAQEAGTVFCEGRVPTLDLYSPVVWRERILPEWERWKRQHVVARQPT
jgi:hypothetical protein